MPTADLGGDLVEGSDLDCVCSPKPGFRFESLERLACVCEEGLSVVGSSSPRQPLGVLEFGDREPEGELAFSENAGCTAKALLGCGRVTGELGATTCSVRLEEGRPSARPQALDRLEELLDPGGVTELDGALQRLDEAELDVEKADAELRAGVEHRIEGLLRRACASFCSQHLRLVQQI